LHKKSLNVQSRLSIYMFYNTKNIRHHQDRPLSKIVAAVAVDYLC